MVEWAWGCFADVPDYPFDEQYDRFAFNSLLTRDEAISAIGKVRTECNRVAAMLLFHIPTAKHMRLEEFDQTQSQATSTECIHTENRLDTEKKVTSPEMSPALRRSGTNEERGVRID
ncbi:hypothetical protein LSH36_335g03003 [Paralvinella palmiformis]|uniref:Uncharacterized protein n=1 Tax=Paralvinella palmiformis TaxID=53620 RepID=A0AAD9JFN6_9ANNE|nr:hypothetical protein LSH36_335g03003 [Paralvinella palmiformis]